MTFLAVLGALAAHHGSRVVKTLGPVVFWWNLLAFLVNTGYRAWISLSAAVILVAFMTVLEYQRRTAERLDNELEALRRNGV